jgi:hypothetical protein
VSEADIAQAAQCFNTPMFTFGITNENTNGITKITEGKLKKQMPDMSGTGLIVTAIVSQNGKMALRFYEAEGKSHRVDRISEKIGCKALVTDLAGKTLDEITPYRIGYICFDSVK